MSLLFLCLCLNVIYVSMYSKIAFSFLFSDFKNNFNRASH
jgi:hypothetical protein